MQSRSLTKILQCSAASGAMAASLGLAAHAQEAPQVVQLTPAPEEETAPASADRVVVTGTRLPNQFTSASPMDIIAADEAATQGLADVASLLRNSTVAAGSTQITAVSSTAFVQDGGTGTESISLRGLGANRTLVLLDGRRAGPAGTRGSVGAFDLNVIPLSAIERVEILKDGASSIYGSDAIAGVVNIITKTGEGLDADLFLSQPTHQGGEQLRASLTWGHNFDQGRFSITADYYKQEELARGQRDFFACGAPYVFNADGSRADLVDPRTGEYSCNDDLPWGHVWFYDYNEPGAVSRPWRARPQLIQFDYDNNLGNYLPGFGPTANPLTVPAGWFPVGYGELLDPTGAPDAFYGPSARVSQALVNLHHPFQDVQSLSPEIQRTTVFANGEYDLSDHLQIYGEALLNRRVTKVNSYRQFWTYQYIYDYGYGYVYGDPLAIADGWSGDFFGSALTPSRMGFSPTAITDHNGDTTTVDYMRFVAGARGDFGNSGWKWDASLQFSRSEGEYKNEIVWDDAITPYKFRNDLCAGTLTVDRSAPCVDINWFDPQFLAGEFTDAERAFLFGEAVGNTVYEQASLEAYTSGSLFTLPAGPVASVFGILLQKDRLNDTPDTLIQQGLAWNDSTSGVTKGDDFTRAAYLEFGVPLLKDMAFAQDLSLTASARYTDVDSYGAETTYKVGLNWQPIESLSFRASQGTSFRSPALFELFLANETGFLGQRDVDPCVNWGANLASGGITQRLADNCLADGIPDDLNGSGAGVTITSSGGFGRLAAETSTSKSIGVVWRPDFIDLQLSLDYFDIEVNDEVTKLGAPNILFGCYSSENFSTEPLCDLFNRNPAGGSAEFLITTVTDDFINIATQTNRGLDFEAVYNHDFSFGRLGLTAQASHQLEDVIDLLPGSEPLDFNGEMGDPEWVANFNATLDTGPWSFFYGLNYIGEVSNVDSFGDQPQTYLFQPVRFVLSADAFTYHDISVSRQFENGFNVRLGVSNVLDEEPPFVSTGTGEFNMVGNVPITSQYDFLGRTIFLNVQKSF